jgi:hypothetical protein
MDTKIYRALKQLKTVGLIGEGTRVVRRKKRRGRRRVKKQLGQGVQQSGHMMGSGSVMKTTPTVQSEQAIVNLQASELQLKNALKNKDMPDEDRKKVLLAIEDIQRKEDMYKNAIGHILHKVKAIEDKNSGYIVEEIDEEEEDVPPVPDFSNAPLFKPQTKATNITVPVTEAHPTTFTVPSTPAVFETPQAAPPAGGVLFNAINQNPFKWHGGSNALPQSYVQDEDELTTTPLRTLGYEKTLDYVPAVKKNIPQTKSDTKANESERTRTMHQKLFADEEESTKPAVVKQAPVHKRKTETWLRNFETLITEYKKEGGNDPGVFAATTHAAVKAAIKELQELKEQKDRYANMGGKDPAILQSTKLRDINDAVDAIIKTQTTTPKKKSKK